MALNKHAGFENGYVPKEAAVPPDLLAAHLQINRAYSRKVKLQFYSDGSMKLIRKEK